MKRSDAQRVAILVEALDSIADLDKAAMQTEPDPLAGDWRGVSLAIEDFCEAGSQAAGHMALPLDIGMKLVPIARKLIEDELAKLGVEP